MTFPCVKCGLCCKKVGMLDKSLNRGDGACIHLKEDNICNIYDNRPNICRIDEMKPNNISTKQWYEINLEFCKKLGANI